MLFLVGCSDTSKKVESVPDEPIEPEFELVIVEPTEEVEIIEEPVEAELPIEPEVEADEVVPIEPPVEEEPVEVETEDTNTGNSNVFRITAYCNCSTCCGQWAGGNTASGTVPTAGKTIAVDPSVIPWGTEVVINGHTYVAEDSGSGVNGNSIDIYFDSHEDALQWGVQYLEVEILG